MIRLISVEEFQEVLSRCRRQGYDVAEVANRGGFLLTEERFKEIQADVLDDVAKMLEESGVNAWLITEYKHPNTEDVRIGIADRLRKLAQATRQVGWRKS